MHALYYITLQSFNVHGAKRTHGTDDSVGLVENRSFFGHTHGEMNPRTRKRSGKFLYWVTLVRSRRNGKMEIGKRPRLLDAKCRPVFRYINHGGPRSRARGEGGGAQVAGNGSDSGG